jgi:hypothetical protein
MVYGQDPDNLVKQQLVLKVEVVTEADAQELVDFCKGWGYDCSVLPNEA